MLDLENCFAFLLFFLEIYHILGHISVLFRIRLLPRKDLVRIRYYFLFDLLTVFASSVLFLRRLQWLACLQIAQHMYYFITWDKSRPAKKIISWSSLDWTKSQFQHEWHLDSILGTAFDVGVHSAMGFLLGQYLSTAQIFVAIFLVKCSSLAVMCGPWYAWSSPWATTPKWVEKRIRPLQADECRLGWEQPVD
ncbi:hypothetical protein FSP39_002753 [Pinctada imbricata]|uniref:Uncharacterized protein n=1 Tax=Pinctada imbricata TaxID=66713 RepID=A0AA88Y784_PINIB|nr:hypothetical protein FSP39_002753 [Pinctada imbricata]